MRKNPIFVPDWVPQFSDRDLEKVSPPLPHSGLLTDLDSPPPPQSFKLYYDLQLRYQILTALLLYSLTQLTLLPFEYQQLMDSSSSSSTSSSSAPLVRMYLILFRLLIALFCLLGWIVLWKRSRINIRRVLVLVYNLLSLAFCAMSSFISYQFHLKGELKDSPFLFFWGPWSLGNSLFFCFMCFNCSGLLIGDATAIAGLHTLLVSVLPFLLFSTSVPSLPYTIFLLPAFLFFEMLYVHSVEMETRTRYLNQLEAGRDLCRQDKLISSILPAEISLSLKGGNNKIEKLASYYDDVTILFCYIVDFTEHSFVTHPHDTVELSRRIVSVFDRIVEQTGAYKVENIADTYMVCAGCPVKSQNHTLVIARTALAMIKAAETRCWRWPDSSPVQLKIGIHTGAVTAGVIGTKSYSYHLFGDAVNTASRMCSHSTPGKILLSTNTFQKLNFSYEEIFRTSERGELQVKGKGLMKLYWLDGFATQFDDFFAVNMNHQSNKRAYTDRYAQLRASESFKIAVNRYTLRFTETDDQLSLEPDESSNKSSNLFTNRRGSQVGQEAAAAVSAGLNRILSNGFETTSPQIQCRHEVEVSSERVPTTSEFPSRKVSSRSDQSRKFTTTVRNFGSSVDDDSAHIREPDSIRETPMRGEKEIEIGEMEYHRGCFKEDEEEFETFNSHSPIQEATPSRSVVTKDNLLKMERSYRRYFDSKSVPIQIHTLCICVIFTFLNFLYRLFSYRTSQWSYPLARFFVFFMALAVAKTWLPYRDYSQEILLLTGVLTLVNKTIESLVDGIDFDSIPITIIFILFSTIFLRIRYHFILVYVFIIFVTISIRVITQLTLEADGDSEYDILAGVYAFTTLLFAVWWTYIQELMARTEFVDLFIMKQEMLKSEHLLSNMLPTSTHAFKLLKGDFVLDELHDVTLLYSDIKGFTPLASSMHPIKLCKLLNEIYSSFDKHLNEFGMYKVDIIGDAFVVIGGIPGYKDHSLHARNAVLFAFHMLEDIRIVKQKYKVDLEIRIGIHSGGCTGSVISVNKPRYLIWGPNSIIANHLEATGIPGLVHISETTMEKLQPELLHEFGIEFTVRSETDRKNILLNNEHTYLLSCKDFSDINTVVSGKSETVNFRTHQYRFGAALAQIPFRKYVGNRIRNLTVDTILGTSSARVHIEGDSRRERASSDPHGVRPRRAPDSPHSSMLQTAITSSYFGGPSGRRSLSSVSTDSHADSEHGSHSNRKRLDSNESVTSNNSHTSSPRGATSNRIQPFEENQMNFGSSAYTYREVTFQMPKGWEL